MDVLGNGVELTWLGHATWLIRTPAGTRVLVDPWLEGNPSCPDRFKAGGLGAVDLVLVTHGHHDHMGDLEAVARTTDALVVAIFDLTSWLETKGVGHVLGMNKGGTVQVADLTVTMTNAVHSSGFMDGDRAVNLGSPCGFVIGFENGFRIYHAGDTAVFSDMALIGELYRPDLAILPIGDHFTMGPLEAAKAAQLLGVRRVVPSHFGTFPLLTGTPEALRALVNEEVEVLTLHPGQTLA